MQSQSQLIKNPDKDFIQGLCESMQSQDWQDVSLAISLAEQIDLETLSLRELKKLAGTFTVSKHRDKVPTKETPNNYPTWAQRIQDTDELYRLKYICNKINNAWWKRRGVVQSTWAESNGKRRKDNVSKGRRGQ